MAYRILVSTAVLATGLATVASSWAAGRPALPPLPSGCDGAASVSCGNNAPQYAVAEFGADMLGAEATLTESGHVQFAVIDGYPRRNLYEWSPTTGMQFVGVRDKPWTEQTPYGVVSVLDGNSVAGWVGKTGNPSISNVVVGNASGAVTVIPATANPGSLPYMYPYDINDHSMVVGYAELPNNHVDRVVTTYDTEGEAYEVTYSRNGWAPFVWTPEGGTKMLSSLPQTYEDYGSGSYAMTFSVASAVNNGGQVVGSDALHLEYTSPGYAFIWNEATGMRSLGRMVGHNASSAADINDAGVVVGRSGITSTFTDYWGASKGFIWTEADGMLALDDLLTEADKARGVHIKEAGSINESGQILAMALGGGGLRYVLLTPVPEPGTAPLMALGALGALLLSRRVRAFTQAG
jgi:hypothetical protein